MATKITVTVGKGGETAKVAVDGVAGPSCTDLTKRIEAALGTTIEDTPTGDFYQTEENEYATAHNQ